MAISKEILRGGEKTITINDKRKGEILQAGKANHGQERR